MREFHCISANKMGMLWDSVLEPQNSNICVLHPTECTPNFFLQFAFNSNKLCAIVSHRILLGFCTQKPAFHFRKSFKKNNLHKINNATAQKKNIKSVECLSLARPQPNTGEIPLRTTHHHHQEPTPYFQSENEKI